MAQDIISSLVNLGEVYVGLATKDEVQSTTSDYKEIVSGDSAIIMYVDSSKVSIVADTDFKSRLPFGPGLINHISVKFTYDAAFGTDLDKAISQL